MTKKEQKNIITKHVIEMVQKCFNVSEEFNDEEGRGYFTFAVIDTDGNEFRFDMGRNDFTIISHKVRGEKLYNEAKQLEQELDEFIENEISIVSIKEGII
jgi:hypothetical protein